MPFASSTVSSSDATVETVHASTAANVYVDIARDASTRAAFNGFPASAQTCRRASPATTFTRISARLWAGITRRAFGGIDRAPRFRGASLGDAADELAGIGRPHHQPLARLDPLARR